MRCVAVLIPLNTKKEYSKPVLVKSIITRTSEYITHERANNDIVAQFHNATLIASCFVFEMKL